MLPAYRPIFIIATTFRWQCYSRVNLWACMVNFTLFHWLVESNKAIFRFCLPTDLSYWKKHYSTQDFYFQVSKTTAFLHSFHEVSTWWLSFAAYTSLGNSAVFFQWGSKVDPLWPKPNRRSFTAFSVVPAATGHKQKNTPQTIQQNYILPLPLLHHEWLISANPMLALSCQK